MRFNQFLTSYYPDPDYGSKRHFDDLINENAWRNDLLRRYIPKRHQFADLYDGAFGRHAHDRTKIARRKTVCQIAPTIRCFRLDQRHIGGER